MIVATDLCKRYPGSRDVLSNIFFEISSGELILLTGQSGAGKSTLLKLIASIERLTSGHLIVNGQDMAKLSRTALPYLRRHMGIVFQDQKLLMDRSVLDNVLLPLEIVGMPHREAVRRAQAALDKVGLLDREKSLPITLSGGEQQRLAIARAVVNRPTILMADEPTANLDQQSSAGIISLFSAFHQAGTTVIIATHDAPSLRQYQPRILHLDQGRLL